MNNRFIYVSTTENPIAQSHFSEFVDNMLFVGKYKDTALFDFAITVGTISTFLIGIIIIVFLILLRNKVNIKPSKLQFIMEKINKFILNIIEEQTKGLAIKYFPIFLTLFVTVLLMNITGIIPGGVFTVTSQIAVTFLLSLSLFIANLTIANINSPMKFLKSFIPNNVPLAIKILLSIIEFFSYILRPISMAVRLFANMMAGHILLQIVNGATVKIIKIGPIILAIPMIAITMAIQVLEMGISALQAYIIVILFSIYIFDSLKLYLNK